MMTGSSAWFLRSCVKSTLI